MPDRLDDGVPPGAEQVRQRSLARARALGVPTNEHLPFVDEPVVRPAVEVVSRMLTLHGVMAALHGAREETVLRWLEQEGLTPELSPLEADVLAGRSRCAWHDRVECLWAFAWALGRHDDLEPTRPCAHDFVTTFPDLRPAESTASFREGATLRPVQELYEQADLHYVLTWGARESGPHTPIDVPAVFERRRALDWLIDPERMDWDDITLDT